MTIPSLITRHQDKAIVTSVKQAYSILNNAFIAAQYEYGPANTWTFSANGTATDGWFEYISKYLQLIEDCGKVKGLYTPCYPQGTKIKTLYGKENRLSYTHGGILKNGMYIFVKTQSDIQYASWGWITVDINGVKKPNTYGKDIFSFGIYATKEWSRNQQPRLLPVGMRKFANLDMQLACLSGDTYTGYLAEGDFKSGEFCTGWIMKYENVDYLHCRDELIKNKKHSCK